MHKRRGVRKRPNIADEIGRFDHEPEMDGVAGDEDGGGRAGQDEEEAAVEIVGAGVRHTEPVRQELAVGDVEGDEGDEQAVLAQRAGELAPGMACPFTDRGKQDFRWIDRRPVLANQSGGPGAVARHGKTSSRQPNRRLAGSRRSEAIGSSLRIDEGCGRADCAKEEGRATQAARPSFPVNPSGSSIRPGRLSYDVTPTRCRAWSKRA
jgi:hypothetical protein